MLLEQRTSGRSWPVGTSRLQRNTSLSDGRRHRWDLDNWIGRIRNDGRGDRLLGERDGSGCLVQHRWVQGWRHAMRRRRRSSRRASSLGRWEGRWPAESRRRSHGLRELRRKCWACRRKGGGPSQCRGDWKIASRRVHLSNARQLLSVCLTK